MTTHTTVIAIEHTDSQHPHGVRTMLGDDAPPTLYALGNLDLLTHSKLAFLCSRKCPGRLILRSVDLANELAESDITVVGGFHTPVEKEFLRVILRGRASAVVCPARSLERMRVAPELRRPFDEGRILFLSPFTGTVHRPTIKTGCARNQLVIALADRILVGHVEPDSMTNRAVQFAKDARKHVCPIDVEG